VRARLSQLCGTLLMAAVLIHCGRPMGYADEIHLSLASALDRTRIENPRLAIAQAQVSETEGMREQAGVLPNTCTASQRYERSHYSGSAGERT
jgi:hypothetical protein